MRVEDNMNTRGFTVVELMLSVTVIALMAGISIPIYRTFTTRNDADLAAQLIAQAIRTAEIQALLGRSGTNWGVYVTAGSVTVFSGDTYATRDTSLDNTQEISSSLTVSGDQEYVFPLGMVEPQMPGVTTLISTDQSSRSIEVNALGMVTY